MSAVLKPAEPRVGIFTDEPGEIYYQRDPGVANATGLKIIHSRTPKHFHYWATHPEHDKRSDALEFGKALHSATLEPDVFERAYTVLPKDTPRDMRRFRNAKNPSLETLASIDWWDSFEASNRGKIFLSAENFDRVRYMGDSMRENPETAGLLTGGLREATLRWIDPETGLPCKARVDNMEPGEWMVDLKSCADAGEPFARSAAGFAYDLAAFHYVCGAEECGVAVPHYILLACESEPPFDCVPYYYGLAEQQRGQAIRNRAIRIQAECVRTGKWPGRANGLTQLTYPTWAFYGIEDMQ